MSSFLHKLCSIKTLVTAWCLGLITYAIAADKTDWSNVVLTLTAVPISYSYFNVKQKELSKNDNDHGNN